MSGGRRDGGVSGSSSNEWWWCGGGYGIILDIRLYNNNYYNKGGVGCGGVGLWIRTNFTRFTLKMTHFWVTMVKNELKPYNLQGF